MSPIPTLHPLGKTLGTEALGINLATALDAPTIAWIQQSFAEHPVLVFRNQDIGANDGSQYRSPQGSGAPRSRRDRLRGSNGPSPAYRSIAPLAP